MYTDIGAILGPFDAWLLLRGLKRLSLRMEKHCENAEVVAEWLQQHSRVDVVRYPGLASHPQHELAVRQCRGGFGGMMYFEIRGGVEAGRIMMNQVQLCTLAVSLGSVDTLIQRPAYNSQMEPEELATVGISPGLVRLSVGIEHVDDIIEDLDGALRKV